MSDTNTEAAICISGDPDYNFNSITEILRIEPTKIWRCKPQVANQSPELNKATWIYELPDLEHVEFSDLLSEIVNVVWNSRNEIRDLADRDRLSIAFVLTLEGQLRNYSTVVCPLQVKRIAEFNASVSFNFDKLES